ncbi:MAG: DUF1854 domain-containing protein [Fimbriimonadales bacterium]
MELRYFPEDAVRVRKLAGSLYPRCEIESDRCVLQAKFRRCFPLTDPTVFVSICEESGREVGIIKDPEALDDESRLLVAKELDNFYFTPIVRSITALKQEASMWKWEVETQRGPVSFYLRGVRDSVHEVAPGRWQIYSVDGQRYEIQNYDSLDAKTQHLFESLF